jgi:outer membrane protein OmpA-like peptidoglycan-associated protein
MKKETNMTQPNLLALTLVGTLLSCVAQPPSELVSARHAYANAQLTEAPTLVPKELHEAEVALGQAESAFDKDPRGFRTADLAYVAERKSQMAVAAATIARAKTDSAHATGELADVQEQKVAQSKADLDAEHEARMAADEARTASDQARVAAETREQAALATLAAVNKEDRGLVVTLSGSVLFKSGESTLLPEAQTRIAEVGKALMETKDRSLVVEGHTDSQGSDVSNQQLSQRRAEAVKSYLVSAGYSSSLINAQGMGEARPVADNATAEGRANNRRVEIVVKP